jgi:hypothetical protein
MVNKQQSEPTKPHGHNVPDAWPFPVFPAKAWTPKEVEEYEKLQRQRIPDAPM